MKQYKHLTLDEREKLFIMRNQGISFAGIGKVLNRNASTLSRECKRNKPDNQDIGYLPDTANQLAKARRQSHGTKINKNPELKLLILQKMRDDRYSPEMIAGVLQKEQAEVTISTESIYQYIYSKEGKEAKLYQYLMRARSKRNQQYGRKTRSNHGIPDRISITQRAPIKEDDFGHFEADLTFFKTNSKINLVTMVERKTGYLMAELNHSKKSDEIALKIINNLLKIPKKKRRTITYDNGKEFVLHNKIKEITGVPGYFCHPGSPWEKPYVEYTHALLHRYIAKNINSNNLTEEIVQDAVRKLNNLPRKRFGFKTPTQMMAEEKIFKLDALRP